MTRFETPQVAVIGAGEIGRGWAALCVAAGWPVTLYEPDGEILNPAMDAITERVQSLVDLKRADATIAEDALNNVVVGRSLLQAVGEAGWIIECLPDDLPAKVKALHLTEQVARRSAVLSSSSSGFTPTDLGARLERPERLLVLNPLLPVELIPLVEVAPSPRTDPEVVEDIRFWLSMLGRAPIILKKEIVGSVANRFTAALWRECIQLVLDGVLDVEDVDRAVALGPALGWAAAGPHLEHHLAAGQWGAEMHLSQQLGNFSAVWKSLAGWSQLEPEAHQKFIRAVVRAYTEHNAELRSARNSRLVRILEALNE
jgi:3-hydroxyacyl-CoA dehydrogenase